MDAETFQLEAMQHERLLYRVSWGMLRNNEDCADAIQEALTRAWQKRDSLRNLSSFRPWLVRILTNTCTDMLRKRPKQDCVPIEEDTAIVEQNEDPVPLHEAIDRLSSEQRVVTLLHYLEGYSIKEISDMLGVPSGTVKSRLMYARQRLQTLLQAELEG